MSTPKPATSRQAPRGGQENSGTALRFLERSNTRSTESARTGRATAFAETMAQRVRQTVLDAILHIDGDAMAMDRPALTVARAAETIAPARLASAHPGGAAAREEACRLYERCLAHYRQAVRPQDEARGVDDVGAAVAAFVAANLGALHGTPVTPDLLLRLERQLGGIARLTADWDTAPARERQAYFEQMALLAVLIAESASQAGPQGAAAVANVQRAARGYLQQLLGLAPAGLTLGPNGLAASTAAAPANLPN
jgi:hypothetical protein